MMLGTDPGCGTNSSCLYRASLSDLGAAQFVGGAPTGTFLNNLAISCAGAGFTIEPQAQQMGTNPRSRTPSRGVRSKDAGANALLAGLNLTNGVSTAIGAGFGVNNLLAGVSR